MRVVIALLIGIASLLSFASAQIPAADFVDSPIELRRKRQSSDSINDCVNELLKKDLQTNSECYQTLSRFRIESPLEFFMRKSIASVVCQPSCGIKLLEALDVCDVQPELREFMVGLCGSDRNGTKCYEHFDTYDTPGAFGCFTISDSQTCASGCKSLFEMTAQQLGCCLSVYNQYFTDVIFNNSNINVTEIYTNACKVAEPKGCNNSALDVEGCVDRTLRTVLQPNSDCYRQVSIFIAPGDISQDMANSIYPTLCKQDCNSALVEAYKQCGEVDEATEIRRWLDVVCGTDAISGKKCYENIVYYEDFLNDTIRECVISSKMSQSCQCKPRLEQIAQKTGCCLSAYNDLFTTEDFNVTELFADTCRVVEPGNCTSVVGAGSRGIAVTTWIVGMAALLAVTFL